MSSELRKAAAPSAALISKLNWRLLPFLLLCYVFATIDRTNVGFAKLQMQSDLGFSDAAYGLGAGIFFIGYMIFEIPSNLMFPKWGARRIFSRILILWGLTSASTAFVNSEMAFYAVRFMLGVFEAGFAPGMIFYLTYWYGKKNRGGALAIVLLAGPVSGIVAGPLSGFILTHMANLGGLHGWQWMFLLESFPCVLFGIVAPFVLVDKPADAHWLSADEKHQLASLQEAPVHGHGSFVQAAKDPTVYIMAIVLFCLLSVVYAVAFWLPSMIRTSGVQDIMTIGFLSTLPAIGSAVAMVLAGRFSDRSGNRGSHVAYYALISAAALLGAIIFDGRLLSGLACVVVANAMMSAGYTVFWTMPPEYLKGDSAAGGIALINTIALASGFVAPNIFGLSSTYTGSIKIAMFIIAGLMVIGAVLAHWLQRQPWANAAATPLPAGVPTDRA